MKKNTKIHFWIESEIKQAIEKQAQEEGLTISDYCRNKLKDSSRLIRIERMLEEVLKKYNKR